MKKIALSIMALAMAAVTFTSCEDVPAPYDYPGNGGSEGVYLNQSFAKDLGDFKSFGTNDNIAWTIDYSSACITGYKDFDGDGTKSNEAGVTYLVSPEIDLTKASKAYIEMNHAMKYERADVNANNTLLISKDYTDDPTKATWTPIAYPTTGLNDASTKEFVFVTSAANIPAEFIGQKVRIAFRHTCTDKQSSTWEIKTLSVKEGEAQNGGGTTPPSEGVGNGTEANPYIVSDITNGAKGNNVFVKAYIVGFVPDKSIEEAKFTAEGCESESNVIVAASADETNVSNVMPVQLPVGAVRTGINLKGNPGNIKQEVVLCGNVENYFGKPGLKAVVWAKIGGKEFGIKPGTDIPIVGTPKGTGTKEDPFNVAAANKYIKDGGDATVEKYVKGKVSELQGFREEYGSISYYISEDGKTANQFYVFGGNNLGGTKFTKLEDLKVGDEVVICGKLKNYNGTYEFDSKNYLVSLNGKKAETGGGEEKPGGGEEKPGGGAIAGNTLTVEASAMGVENAKAMPTITLTDGTKLAFDGGGNQNAPKYYNAGKNIRMYPKNSMTITATKNIEKVEFVVDVYDGVTYNASGDISAEPGKVTTQDTNIIISGISGKSTKFTNTSATTGAASQVRIKTIKITYAK